jgi:OmpA-OmpF porin, OOP family
VRSSEPSPRALRFPRVLSALALAVTALAGWQGEARAQSAYFYLDRAQLSGAPDDGFMVWRPRAGDETRFYGMVGLGYAHNPLRDETVTADAASQYRIDDPIRGQFMTYLSVGTEISKRLSLNIALPIMLYKAPGPSDPTAAGVSGGGIGSNPAAISDLRFDARVMAFETENRRIRMGGGGALWAPTGNPEAFTGDGAVAGMIYGSAEIDFQKFFLTGMLGPQFRSERSIGGVNGSLYTDSELRFAFGAFLPLRGDRFRLGGELWGTTGIAPVGRSNDENTFFAGRNTDIEWLGQARFAIDKKKKIWAMGGAGTRLAVGYGAADFRILASIGTFITLKDFEPSSPPPKITFNAGDLSDPDTDGDGFPDSIDKCPTIKEDGKEPNAGDGCPADADRDRDGIPDNADACPDQPEDKDGIQDTDGCPEDDGDSDGIPDKEDKCPNEAGGRSADPKKVGCPGALTSIDEGGAVQLLRPIEFEYGKAVIKEVSFPILDEVLELMKSRPSITLGVYGHTDNRGAAEVNLRLSRERAAACKNYLINHGISRNRLESQGFGPSQPIADNTTDEGRARNRRVDFKVLKE